MDTEKYILSFDDSGNKLSERLKNSLEQQGFEKVSNTPKDIFKYLGRCGKVPRLGGYSNEIHYNKENNSLIFIEEYSSDSPNHFPRRKDVEKMKINIVNPLPELTDLIMDLTLTIDQEVIEI